MPVDRYSSIERERIEKGGGIEASKMKRAARGMEAPRQQREISSKGAEETTLGTPSF